MPSLPLVQVDAFAERPFEGNPAAVVRLDDWLPDALMANIAMENNLSETAFVRGTDGAYELRWFTPTVEVDLCGHATLAAGHVVIEEDGVAEATFATRSGPLSVRRSDGALAMDLPSHPHTGEPLPHGIAEALKQAPSHGYAIRALHGAAYGLAVYETAAQVAALDPDVGQLRRLPANVICTAPGADGIDFVSRFFAPGSGVDEDPVTGSAHATLAPYWAQRLGRSVLQARQISRRGGSLGCEVRGDRVVLRGHCVEVLRGTLRYA